MFKEAERGIIIDARAPFAGQTKADEKAETFTEYPLAFDLEYLLCLWNKVHSFTVSMQLGEYHISPDPKRSTEIILKRFMCPLGLATPDIKRLHGHPASMIDMQTTYFPTVIMDYPVFLSEKIDKEESLSDSYNSVKHTWGDMMINLGRTKQDITKLPVVLFRPQIGIYIDKVTRSFAMTEEEIEHVEKRSKVGEVLFSGPAPAGPTGPRLIPIYRFGPVGSGGDPGEVWSGTVTINGYFSALEINTPTAKAGFVDISFPVATKYIDYLNYLDEIWAGPIRGRKIPGSFTRKNSRWRGTIEFPKPIKRWSGPIRFSKKNGEDWFLSDQHVELTA